MVTLPILSFKSLIFLEGFTYPFTVWEIKIEKDALGRC